MPADWSLPDEWRAWALTERPELNPERTAASFADYWRGKAGKDGRKADWLATWRNWVRNERTQAQRRQPSEPKYAAAALPPKAAPGKHAGFQNLNYREGVSADGSLV